MAICILTKNSRILKNQFRQYTTEITETVLNKEFRGDSNFQWDTALPYDAIPGPNALPFVGNTWRFLPGIGQLHCDKLEIAKRLHNMYGDIVKVDRLHGQRDIVFLYNPKDFETLHRNEGPWPCRESVSAYNYYRVVTRKDTYKHPGVAAVQGKEWFEIRSILNPIVLRPHTIKMYINELDTIADEFIEHIKYLSSQNINNEMPDNFLDEIQKWSFETMVYIILDFKLGCFNPHLYENETKNIISSICKMFYELHNLEKAPHFWKFYPTPSWKRFVREMDVITKFSIKQINEAMLKIEAEKANNNKSSILESLIKKDKDIAITTATDFFLGGIETTSRTVAAALYYLAKNQDAQNTLRTELQQYLPNSNDIISEETLNNMSYLRAVVKETLRLAPISFCNARITTKNLVLSNYQIPKGVNVVTANLLLCLDNKHFPDAKHFIPERWLRSNKTEYSYKNAHPFVYLPYGYGPRTCIGRRIANLEMEVLLSKIIRNFRVGWNRKDAVFTYNMFYGIENPLPFQMKALN